MLIMTLRWAQRKVHAPICNATQAFGIIVAVCICCAEFRTELETIRFCFDVAMRPAASP